MSEDEKLYHNEEKIIDVLENIFIYKDTYDKFTKLDLECVHDVVYLYKQKKEENEEMQEKLEEIQEKLKEEIQTKNEYIDMLNATGKYSRIFKKDWVIK